MTRSRAVTAVMGVVASFVSLGVLAPSASSKYTIFRQIPGSNSGDRFGSSVAAIGDINADGVPDFIVGASSHDNGGLVDVGAVFVYSGKDGTILRAHFGSNFFGGDFDAFGSAVAGGHDLTNDGVPDYLVGQPFSDLIANNSGLVWLFEGATGDAAAFTIGRAGGKSGFSVAVTGGDAAGDGKGDWVFGDPGSGSDTGAVFYMSGLSFVQRIDGVAAGDRFGFAVSAAGQQNPATDNIPDFAVGAPAFDSSRGLVRTYSGATRELLDPGLVCNSGARCGESIAFVGDVNGDNIDEFVFGGPEDSSTGPNRGYAAIYGPESFLLQYFGVEDSAEFGVAVAGIPDVNGNGRPDVAIAAPFASPGGRSEAGSVIVVDGFFGTVLHTLEGQTDGDNLGEALAGTPDLNQDGRGDVLVGAPDHSPAGMDFAGLVGLYTSPSFFGHLQDPFGAPISLGLFVDVYRSDNLEYVRSGISDANGDYIVPDLLDETAYYLEVFEFGFITKEDNVTLAGSSQRVDFTLGTVVIFTPGNTETVKGFVPVQVDAFDPSGIASVEVFFDDTSLGSIAGPGAFFVFEWPTVVDCAFEGAHTLEAIATAMDGSVGFSRMTNVTVDNTTFPDVPCTHFAWRFVEAVARNNIAAGFPDGTYKPDNTVNRGQMAVFMSRAADLQLGDFAVFTPPACGSESFSDVACTNPIYKFIEYVAAKGIASGFPDDTYKPANGVSRGAMAVFLSRLRDLADGDFAAFTPPACGSESFPDVPCSHASYKFIEYVKAKGIASGFLDGTYRPANIVTRGQMAVFITRASSLPF